MVIPEGSKLADERKRELTVALVPFRKVTPVDSARSHGVLKEAPASFGFTELEFPYGGCGNGIVSRQRV